MQHGVLGAPNIKIDAWGRLLRGSSVLGSHPITFAVAAAECGLVMRVEIAEVIPTTARPLRHGIGFAGRSVG